MDKAAAITRIFRESLHHITGLEGSEPLGGMSLQPSSFSDTESMTAFSFLKAVLDETLETLPPEILERYKAWHEQAIKAFTDYYSEDQHFTFLTKTWQRVEESNNNEEKARLIGQIWVPELALDEKVIIEKWKLYEVTANPAPILPHQVTIQLNALYTLPHHVPETLPEKLKNAWSAINHTALKKIADYDHPVPLFADDAEHELISCLKELDHDIAFEKSRGVFKNSFKLIVTLSISVTHELLDGITTDWITFLLQQNHYEHLSFFILSEKNIDHIKMGLLHKDIPVFSVVGKYARHFNALKYSQLLLETYTDIRAGFKLDTDEGIRSEDLFNTTGKTWFQTLCHQLWGGMARDHHGNPVELAVNEGEYINSQDIDQHGYKHAYRMPEVPLPKSFIHPMIMFNKPYAQGWVTKLYNMFSSLDEHISHPVVKGGGYGITNHGLRKYTPFALSLVGRAEDQQFYFHGLKQGLRGIFHPDLRIAHYKASVQKSEYKQKGTKFLGDMYRLLIFEHIVSLLNIKDDIDPFPGLFCGKLARCQAFFTTLYYALTCAARKENEISGYILTDGVKELQELMQSIDQGEIAKALELEAAQWKDFVHTVSSIPKEEARDFLTSLLV